MQLTHYTSKFIEKKFPIVLVCDNISNAPNIGSLFRIADAFGIEQLILCGEHTSIGRKVTKTSRATEKYVNYKFETDVLGALKNLKAQNYQIIAIEITENSKALSNYKFSTNSPIAIVLGDENFGISLEVLKLSDSILHLEMFGNNSSMNVTQAASITLYEITKQLNR